MAIHVVEAERRVLSHSTHAAGPLVTLADPHCSAAAGFAAVTPRPVTTYGGQSFFHEALERCRLCGGSRTRDSRICGPVLYPLSYTLVGYSPSFVRTRKRNAQYRLLYECSARRTDPDGLIPKTKSPFDVVPKGLARASIH